MKESIFSIFLLCCISLSAWSQEREIISSAGGDDDTGQIYYSYTIGDLIVTGEGQDTLFLASGFEQSEVFVSMNVGLPDIKVEAKVYPNPSSHYFFIEISDENLTNYSVVMHNTKGEFLFQRNFDASNIKIETSIYPAGVYYLTLIDSRGNRMNQFKVIKSE